MGKQTTSHILMVKPSNFGYNPETAESNSFQILGKDDAEFIKLKAIEEFERLTSTMSEKGIITWIYSEPAPSMLTDSVFPNNWISTHQDGTVITYPMFSTMRRQERRPEILELIEKNFHVNKRIYLDSHEEKSRYLEGTGCMILDRIGRIAYACNSVRVNHRVFEEFCFVKGFQPFVFDAFDRQGLPIYHTNVIMSIGVNLCIICGESITDEGQRTMLMESIKASEREVIDISFDQVCHYAGNVLEVENNEGAPYMIMSSQAFNVLKSDQLEAINRHCQIIHSPIPTIEKYGGGGVRCMMAEIFLPKKLVQ